jgi:hypothetical protein
MMVSSLQSNVVRGEVTTKKKLSTWIKWCIWEQQSLKNIEKFRIDKEQGRPNWESNIWTSWLDVEAKSHRHLEEEHADSIV